MANETGMSLDACIKDIGDPRAEGRCEHLLIKGIGDILPSSKERGFYRQHGREV